MSEHGHRTFVGTLVFLDLLDPRPDALECVQDAAARAVGHIETEDVLQVSHPRGVVLVFPGDPEDGLFVALGLRDALEHEATTRTDFAARMSVHLGPVRIVNGVAQGEGPTVGAQLASVATAGQILSSRSFFEVVSSLSAEHKGLLHPLGRRRTAEGKELDVYELGPHVQREAELTWPTGRTPAAGVAAVPAPPVLQPIPLVTPIDPLPPPPPAVAAPVIVTGGWVAGALEELGSLLARSIGPLAHTLVRRAARATEDPRALVAELAESSRTATTGASSRISPERGSAAPARWAARRRRPVRRTRQGPRTRRALPTPPARRTRLGSPMVRERRSRLFRSSTRPHG